MLGFQHYITPNISDVIVHLAYVTCIPLAFYSRSKTYGKDVLSEWQLRQPHHIRSINHKIFNVSRITNVTARSTETMHT